MSPARTGGAVIALEVVGNEARARELLDSLGGHAKARALSIDDHRWPDSVEVGTSQPVTADELEEWVVGILAECASDWWEQLGVLARPG